jgi:hypothetical protein
VPPTKKKKKARKEPFGRPTKYDKKYCQELIDHMSGGLSFEAFAGVISVGPATIYRWVDDYGDFREAKIIAFSKNRLFWEKTGISGLFTEKGRNFNASSWIFNMKNRFGWQDRKEETDSNKIHTVKIELPGQAAQQVISLEPKRLEEGDKDGAT